MKNKELTASKLIEFVLVHDGFAMVQVGDKYFNIHITEGKGIEIGFEDEKEK